MLGLDLREAERLQLGEALLNGWIQGGAAGHEGNEMCVDGGIVSGAGGL